jgi:hypothetical protein
MLLKDKGVVEAAKVAQVGSIRTTFCAERRLYRPDKHSQYSRTGTTVSVESVARVMTGERAVF